MKNWIRKSLMVMVSILTFGVVSPSQFINNVNAEKPPEKDIFEAASPSSNINQAATIWSETHINKDAFVEDLIKQAEEQSYQKFGPRIKPVIEQEFREIVLPNIEKALEETAAKYPESDFQNLIITEDSGGGLSEKIFHLKDRNTNLDVLRFHVRRDHPPQGGYWFNFHYHTYFDDFQNHYELGAIYWSKDTPPKWKC
ncbi:MAG: YpjP family protein [Bacillota bacterium]|nr:YpjP family protein [Bacillota bacterium]